MPRLFIVFYVCIYNFYLSLFFFSYTWHSISYYFKVNSLVVRQLHNLRSDPTHVPF